jgi:hypothetical protein
VTRTKIGSSARLARVMLAAATLPSFLATFRGLGFHEGW